MRVVVQRVRSAAVDVEGETIGCIGPGLLAFLGIRKGDGEAQIEYLVSKLMHLRIFPDDQSPMQRSVVDVGGEVLLVSQFTLYGDCRKGRRPSFDAAMPPTEAEPLYRRFAEELVGAGVSVEEGRFGAHMNVRLENDGPVTVLLDSEKRF